ncbi:hypothetical protein GA0115255_122321, partial [Streptomyces sp. Ncost-T6T-2b]
AAPYTYSHSYTYSRAQKVSFQLSM